MAGSIERAGLKEPPEVGPIVTAATKMKPPIATDGNEDIQHHADDVIFIPRSPAFLQTVLAVVPLQLLAYRIARLRGLNVDQPRNLAKTVTVE